MADRVNGWAGDAVESSPPRNKGKHFFFAKKKQKTLIRLVPLFTQGTSLNDREFLVLFFKKEHEDFVELTPIVRLVSCW